MPTTTTDCTHPDTIWIIDRLGPMQEVSAGSWEVRAAILEQHWECTTCNTHVPRPTNHTSTEEKTHD